MSVRLDQCLLQVTDIVYLNESIIFTIIIVLGHALQAFFVKALSKQLRKLTIITNQLIAIIITNFKAD